MKSRCSKSHKDNRLVEYWLTKTFGTNQKEELYVGSTLTGLMINFGSYPWNCVMLIGLRKVSPWITHLLSI